MSKTKNLVILAVFAAQAIILSIVEGWFPIPVPFPGVKLGLANIITIVLLSFFGLKETLAVICIRIFISSLYGGGFVVFLFSLTGGILSTLAMYLALKLGRENVSLWSVSLLGSIFHNLGQLAVAATVMRDLAVFAYLPVLIISAVIMGVFVGITGTFLVNSLQKTRIFDRKD